MQGAPRLGSGEEFFSACPRLPSPLNKPWWEASHLVQSCRCSEPSGGLFIGISLRTSMLYRRPPFLPIVEFPSSIPHLNHWPQFTRIVVLKVWPWTSSISATWELIRNKSWPHPRFKGSETLGVGPSGLRFNKPSRQL